MVLAKFAEAPRTTGGKLTGGNMSDSPTRQPTSSTPHSPSTQDRSRADTVPEQQADQTMAWILTIATLGIIRFIAVAEGQSRIVTRWGKFIRQTGSGMTAIFSCWGLFERVAPGSIDVRVQTRDYPTKTIFTRDALECDIDTVVYFKITDAGKAHFQVDDYELAIEDFIQATLRNECGKKSARDLLAGRDEINEALRQELESVTRNWGIEIRRVEIKDIDFKHTESIHPSP